MYRDKGKKVIIAISGDNHTLYTGNSKGMRCVYDAYFFSLSVSFRSDSTRVRYIICVLLHHNLCMLLLCS